MEGALEKIGNAENSSDQCIIPSLTCFLFFNPLPNNKILDRFKLKEVADHKINVTQKLKFIICIGTGRHH